MKPRYHVKLGGRILASGESKAAMKQVRNDLARQREMTLYDSLAYLTTQGDTDGVKECQRFINREIARGHLPYISREA